MIVKKKDHSYANHKKYIKGKGFSTSGLAHSAENSTTPSTEGSTSKVEKILSQIVSHESHIVPQIAPQAPSQAVMKLIQDIRNRSTIGSGIKRF